MITFDAASEAENTGAGVGSISWSHTCTGANRLLVVGFNFWDNTNSPTTVTYNGVAMTQVDYQGASNVNVRLYYLINPASGSNTISLVANGAANGVTAGAVSLVGAAQTSVLDTSGKAGTASGTSVTANFTTTVINTWGVAFKCRYNSGTPTPGGGETSRNSSSYADISTKPDLAVGSNSMSATIGANDKFAIVAGAFIPAVDFVPKVIVF